MTDIIGQASISILWMKQAWVVQSVNIVFSILIRKMSPIMFIDFNFIIVQYKMSSWSLR